MCVVRLLIKISTVVAFSKKDYANLQLSANPNKKITRQKFWNYWRRAALEKLKNMHIAWVTFILPQDILASSPGPARKIGKGAW